MARAVPATAILAATAERRLNGVMLHSWILAPHHHQVAPWCREQHAAMLRQALWRSQLRSGVSRRYVLVREPVSNVKNAFGRVFYNSDQLAMATSLSRRISQSCGGCCRRSPTSPVSRQAEAPADSPE